MDGFSGRAWGLLGGCARKLLILKALTKSCKKLKRFVDIRAGLRYSFGHGKDQRAMSDLQNAIAGDG